MRIGTLNRLSVFLCYLLFNHAISFTVQVQGTVQCPFCGQSFELLLDTSVASQRFITDCEVCCRPLEVLAECEPGEILSLDVRVN